MSQLEKRRIYKEIEKYIVNDAETNKDELLEGEFKHMYKELNSTDQPEEDKDKKFECIHQNCGKKFVFFSQLSIHLRLHTGS